MTDRSLLARAARCFLGAGASLDAARCLADSGETAQAVRILREQQRYGEAAEILWRHGDHPLAAWILTHQAAAPGAAREMVRAHAAVDLPSAVGELRQIRSLKENAIDSQEWERAAQQREAEKLLLADIQTWLQWRLILARCDVAEATRPAHVAPVLADVRYVLAHESEQNVPTDPIEEWGVALGTAAKRYDQAALVFAASVQRRRSGALRRWRDWSLDVLQTELTLPANLQREDT